MNSIGLVECKNVSKGILVTDEMLKSAGISLISSGSVCPGKFVTIVGGELSAINGAVEVKNKRAFGIIETFTAASAIEAADAAVKSGYIELIEVRVARGMAGKCFVSLTGDVSDVRAAVEAGAAICAEQGVLINTEVIANPHEELWDAVL